MLKSKSFKTKEELMEWVNERSFEIIDIIIIKDVTNGDWIIFYKG